jgi:hypothetical protein
MINLVDELEMNESYYVKIACGGNYSFNFWEIEEFGGEPAICGELIINLKGKGSLQFPMKWDKNGLPEDMNTYPSRYYTRLVIRK